MGAEDSGTRPTEENGFEVTLVQDCQLSVQAVYGADSANFKSV